MIILFFDGLLNKSMKEKGFCSLVSDSDECEKLFLLEHKKGKFQHLSLLNVYQGFYKKGENR